MPLDVRKAYGFPTSVIFFRGSASDCPPQEA